LRIESGAVAPTRIVDLDHGHGLAHAQGNDAVRGLV
jgi:hypothetical protein